MKRQVYRFLVSLWMMLLYLSVTVASDVVSLACRCECHHHADIHTAFEHTHACECGEHSCHQHQAEEACQGCQTSLSDAGCSCNHSHSTEIELYTPVRNIGDDAITRSTQLLAVVVGVTADAESVSATNAVSPYSRYLLPPLSGAHNGGESLRAPPALV